MSKDAGMLIPAYAQDCICTLPRILPNRHFTDTEPTNANFNRSNRTDSAQLVLRRTTDDALGLSVNKNKAVR